MTIFRREKQLEIEFWCQSRQPLGRSFSDSARMNVAFPLCMTCSCAQAVDNRTNTVVTTIAMKFDVIFIVLPRVS